MDKRGFAKNHGPNVLRKFFGWTEKEFIESQAKPRVGGPGKADFTRVDKKYRNN